MRSSYQPDERWAKWIAYAIMLAAISLLIKVFLGNRSLFIDEANLAQNIVDRGYFALLSPLSGDQFAPPLFLWITNLFNQILGDIEYAFRLFPLLCGIATLGLFYKLLRLTLQPWIVLYPLVLFSFNDYLVKYSTEFKQYSSDMLVTVLLLVLAIKHPVIKNWKQLLLWGLGGAILIWLSMPVVFILAGVGCYFVYQAWKQKHSFWSPGLAISVWLLSFIGYYMILLQVQVGSEYLQNYHQDYFFPFPPLNVQEFETFKNLLHKFIKIVFDSTVLGFLWGALCIGSAVFILFKKSHEKLLLFTIPILSCLIASTFHYYSLMNRLILFLMPILITMIGLGVQTFWRFQFSYSVFLRVFIIGAMLATVSKAGGYNYFVEPFESEEIKKILAYLSEAKSDQDYLYVHHGAKPAFHFYTVEYKYHKKFSFNNTIRGKWKHNIVKKFNSTPNSSDVWLLFTNTWPHGKDRWLQPLKNNEWTIQEKKKVQGASCYLLRK